MLDDDFLHRAIHQRRGFNRCHIIALAAQPLQQHLPRHNQRIRIGNIFAGDIRCGAVRGLRHGLCFAAHQPRRKPQAADDARTQIGEDVAELIGCHHHIELQRVHGHFHREAIHQHFVEFHLGKFFRHLAAFLGKHAAHQPVGRLFMHRSHQFHLARARNLKRRARHTIRALARHHTRADGYFIIGPELAGTGHHGIARLKTFGHFAQKNDINVLVYRRNIRIRFHRLDIGVELKTFTHRRHDPCGVVARIGVVPDGAAQPAVDFFQLGLRLQRKRVPMQLVAALADGVLAPLDLQARFCRGGFHHFDRFGHDFEADVVAQ